MTDLTITKCETGWLVCEPLAANRARTMWAFTTLNEALEKAKSLLEEK